MLFSLAGGGGGETPLVGRALDWSFDSSTIELETSVSNQFDFYYLKHYRTGENLTNETGALTSVATKVIC